MTVNDLINKLKFFKASHGEDTEITFALIKENKKKHKLNYMNFDGLIPGAFVEKYRNDIVLVFEEVEVEE